ncbi:MAG: Mov34/MPN/PAD-1 family protein [Thermoanaerobaculia bacterium]
MPRLLISPEDLATVERWAIAAFPAECCGLLLGSFEGDETVRLVRVEPCLNQAPDQRSRFTISPDSLLAAYRSVRHRGEQVVGTYHSHPLGAAVPSDVDRESAWPGASYLILGVGEDGVRERRSWRLDDGHFVEEKLIVRRLVGGEAR